jgi:hypothetical protein
MSDTPWTPGPWELDGIAIEGSDQRKGAVCLMGEPAQYPGDTAFMCDNWQANARLIAAAPDLYDAVVGLLSLVDAGSAFEHQVHAAQDALAKAKGAA